MLPQLRVYVQAQLCVHVHSCVSVCVYTQSDVGLSSPLDMPGGGSGDRIHCCCRPSFCDNVIMGQDSWQLCFLSAQIFCDINNKCQSSAMSTTTQQAHDWVLMCPLSLLPSSSTSLLTFFLLIPVCLYSASYLPFSVSTLVSMCYCAQQSFPPTQTWLPSFYSYLQMPLHAKWSIKSEHGHIKTWYHTLFSEFWGNICDISRHLLHSWIPINSQMYDPPIQGVFPPLVRWTLG